MSKDNLRKSEALTSMRKSVHAILVLLLILLAACVALLNLPASVGKSVLLWPVALLALSAFVLLAAGRLVMERQLRLESGQRDLFLALNESRSEQAVLRGNVPVWSWIRRWIARNGFGHSLLVADHVRVKSLDAIRATLDHQSCLDGLPFMKEMEEFCGQPAQVYRILDKVYDYGRSRLMRRLDNAVLLVGLRCNGSAHGGCEAACYLIWKAEWLEPLSSTELPKLGTEGSKPDPEIEVMAGATYSCQYTQLTSASRPQAALSAHALLGPMVVGNVSLGAFLTFALTGVFNAFQRKRGGVDYPAMPAPGSDRTIAGAPLNQGDWVRVKTSVEIARTLDKNSKNKGLWFDRDMLKFCGQDFQVRGKVRQIVDITSLAMIPMKTPCIVLETVHFTGEFQGFGEQHDYLYWREAWLQPISAPEHPVR